MNIICGKLIPTEGELRWNDKTLNFTSPIDAHQAGIAIAPQELNLCPQLSVAENIVLETILAVGSESTGRQHDVWLRSTLERSIRHQPQR